MYCENCGIEVDKNAAFCSQCGHPLMKKSKVLLMMQGIRKRKKIHSLFSIQEPQKERRMRRGYLKRHLTINRSFNRRKGGYERVIRKKGGGFTKIEVSSPFG